MIGRLFRRVFLLAGLILTGLALYVPFRIIAQEYNTAYVGGSADFAYSFSVILWPVYAFIFPLGVCLVARTIKVRWYGHVLLLIIVFLAWDSSPQLDDVLGIDAGGLDGFRGYPVSDVGYNTARLSTIACPIAFLSGAAAGMLVGQRVSGAKRRREEGHCRTCGYSLSGNVSGVCPECGSSCTKTQPEGDEHGNE